jgi:hypothetical protein
VQSDFSMGFGYLPCIGLIFKKSADEIN